MTDQIFSHNGGGKTVALSIYEKTKSTIFSSVSRVYKNSTSFENGTMKPWGIFVPLYFPRTMLRCFIRMLYTERAGIRVLRIIDSPAIFFPIDRYKKRPSAQDKHITFAEMTLNCFPCISRQCRSIRQNEQITFCQHIVFLQIRETDKTRIHGCKCMLKRRAADRTVFNNRKSLFKKNNSFAGCRRKRRCETDCKKGDIPSKVCLHRKLFYKIIISKIILSEKIWRRRNNCHSRYRTKRSMDAGDMDILFS